MNVESLGFVKDMVKAAGDMWLKGWHERNGGNASYRLKEEEAALVEALAPEKGARRRRALDRPLPELEGEAFLVTGSGKYVRNVALDPEDTLGIVRILGGGAEWELLWGFSGGANPTSELAAHLGGHAARKRVSGGGDRVILHSHATNLIALSYRYPADSALFTRLLWEMSTECLVVFPDGVGVLPWMVPGTEGIGVATAALMERHRLVLWPFHGVFGSGADPDEAFGLIDTAEKAAEILVKVDSMGGRKFSLSTGELESLAERFSVTPMPGVLER